MCHSTKQNKTAHAKQQIITTLDLWKYSAKQTLKKPEIFPEQLGNETNPRKINSNLSRN